MSTILYRLGRFAYRRRWLVVIAWLAVLVLANVGAALYAGETEDSLELPGTESVEALELLQERFPEAASNGAAARVVFAADEGEALSDPRYQEAIAEAVQRLNALPDVAAAAGPFDIGAVSPDGRIGYAEVEFGVSLPEDGEAKLREAVAPAVDAGLTVEVAGGALQEELPEGYTAELIGLGVALVVLVITFGSFVAAGMPLLNAVIGIGITTAAVGLAARYLDLGSTTPILATMLGLALAIDYSLFIVSRYRHELAVGNDGEESAGRALGTAGSAVVFAGLTVIVAMVALWVVGIPILTEMGLAAAFAVAVAVLVALTMLPAMCGFARRWIAGGRIPGLRARDPEADEGRPGIAGRWGSLVTRHPVAVLAVLGLALLAMAVPATALRLGLPDEGTMPEDTTQRRAYDLLAEGFGPGANGPLMVVVDTTGSADPQAAATRVADTVAGLDHVAAVHPPMFNAAGDTAVITVVPTTGPSSVETEDLVTDIREHADALEVQTGATVAVTGTTAVVIDFSDKMARALLPYLGLVAGLSFLLLMVVFRSVLVPLKAALGFLLTTGATFGAVVAVFQWGWLTDVLGVDPTGLVISFLPIILIGIVFGLSMDYQVFIVTRIREEYVHGAAPVPSIVSGLRHGSRVVTAAAVIMISVFVAFTISSPEFITQIALALAVAIALDAFVVRMTLVPAVLTLLDRRAWWLPRWLDRILPVVDVEGERLRRTAPDRELVGAAR